MIIGTITKAVQLWESIGRPRVTPVGHEFGSGVRHCPSSHPSQGGRAFAWRRSDGPLSFHRPATQSTPETDVRVRYVGRCIQDRCDYWAGNCQLGAMVTRVIIQTRGTTVRDRAAVDRTNPCPIMETCRWIHENGPEACFGCSDIDYAMRADSAFAET